MVWKKNHKAFTLIEMLIVIVIIGVVAVAIVPKLQSVQARARDAKRRADITTIGTALRIKHTDLWHYPIANEGTYPTCVTLPSSPYSEYSAYWLATALQWVLTVLPVDPSLKGLSGMNSMPSPPVVVTPCTVTTDPNYLYTSLVSADGVTGGWFMLMWGVEVMNNANFLVDYPMAYIAVNMDSRDNNWLFSIGRAYAGDLENCWDMRVDNPNDAIENECPPPTTEQCTMIWHARPTLGQAARCPNPEPNSPECEDLQRFAPAVAEDVWCNVEWGWGDGGPVDCASLWTSDYSLAIANNCSTPPPAVACAYWWVSNPAVAVTPLWCQQWESTTCSLLAWVGNNTALTAAGCIVASSGATAATYVWRNQNVNNVKPYVCPSLHITYGSTSSMVRSACTIIIKKSQEPGILRSIARYVSVQ